MRPAPLSAALLLLFAATPLLAQEEDAAHRADRLRTRALNTGARPGYNAAPGVSAADARAFAEASAAYRAQLERWRERVAACQAGDDAACAR